MRRLTAATMILAALLLAVAGCGALGTRRPALEGSQWRLSEWTLSSLTPADFTITARFADGRVSGNSGVNSYSGPYQVGLGDAFSVGQIAGTGMAGPEAAMRAETAYLTLLGQAKSYKLANGTLTLYDAYGNESLIFELVKG
jgi:heat shock protein HslJ